MDTISLFMAKIPWDYIGYISIGFFLVLIFLGRLKDKLFGSKSKSN
jgi:hypothetical protein